MKRHSSTHKTEAEAKKAVETYSKSGGHVISSTIQPIADGFNATVILNEHSQPKAAVKKSSKSKSNK